MAFLLYTGRMGVQDFDKYSVKYIAMKEYDPLLDKFAWVTTSTARFQVIFS